MEHSRAVTSGSLWVLPMIGVVTSKVKPLTGLAQFDVDIGTRRGYRLWGSDGILLLDAPRPHGATSDTVR